MRLADVKPHPPTPPREAAQAVPTHPRTAGATPPDLQSNSERRALLSPSQEEERELRAAAEEPRRLTARSGQRREQTSRPPGIKNPFLGRDEVEARVLLLDGRGAS